MARPDVGEVTEQLYEAFGPLTAGDEDTDWTLLRLCEAICAGALEQVHDYADAFFEDGSGWAPATTPAPALGYVSQFNGTQLTGSMSEAEKREAIALPAGWRRGTPAALEQAVKRTLTDNQTVHIDERYTGDAYQLRVRTLDTETPEIAATLAAVLSQKPVGIVATVEAITGQDWDDVVSKYATWDDVVATHATWDSLVTELP